MAFPRSIPKASNIRDGIQESSAAPRERVHRVNLKHAGRFPNGGGAPPAGA